MVFLRDLQQALKSFGAPDSAELNLGALKLKYSETLQSDAAAVATLFRSQRVLFANMEHELWMYVFPSLEQMRGSFSQLSGKLHAKGPGDVRSAVDWVIKVITAYLSIYETDYRQFMDDNSVGADLAPAHKERDWPALGAAARDLLELRTHIGAAVQTVNAFADSANVIEWQAPSHAAAFWVRYAADRRFCPVCGLNLYYGDEGECTRCPPRAPMLLLRPTAGEPDTQVVFVAGNFTDWKPIEMEFSYQRWSWLKRLDLPPGTYLYKFKRRGKWFIDPNNKDVETDAAGNRNSILIVL